MFNTHQDNDIFEEPFMQEGPSTVVLGDVHYDFKIHRKWGGLTVPLNSRGGRKVTLEPNDIHTLEEMATVS